MDKYQFFTFVSIIAHKYKAEVDINFDTNEITFTGSENDPIKNLQMMCELEDLLGYHSTGSNVAAHNKEVYIGVVKIKLE